MDTNGPTNGPINAPKKDRDTEEPLRKRKRVLQTPLRDIITANDEIPEITYALGLRFVVPYYFKFHVYAKRRWLGKSILEVFSTEFQALSHEYYKSALVCGNLTVNGKITKEGYLLKDNDLIIHSLHRHEPPITAQDVKILHQDANILVVYKPASVPVHPTGRYRHNTLVKIMELKLKTKLHICHRLDRLTSGIQILAKNSETANKITKGFANHEVKKTYLALCRGRFPAEKSVKDPIKVVCGRTGLCAVNPEGKECETHFTLLRYDEENDQSLLKCVPVTGRMHQIRVHLAHHGHCIPNDPIYSRKNWCKSSAAEFSAEMTQVYHAADNAAMAGTPEEKPGKRMPVLGVVDETCSECKARRLLPHEKDMFIYLHAVKYVTCNESYICPLPPWCNEEWVPEDLKIKPECVPEDLKLKPECVPEDLKIKPECGPEDPEIKPDTD